MSLRSAESGSLGSDAPTRFGASLHWLAVGVSLLVGALVVLPFYAYGIPPEVAGASDAFDVKNFWPFASEGLGLQIHVVAMLLAVNGPILLVATLALCIVELRRANGLERLKLVIAMLAVSFVGMAFLRSFGPILAWHFD